MKQEQVLATLCYVDSGDSYLLLYRNKKANDIHEGKWVGTGGKFEPGETPEECVMREVKEETGLMIQNPELRGTIMFPLFDGQRDWFVFVYVAKHSKTDISSSDEGKLEWIPYDQILQLPTWEGDYIFLKWLLERKPYFSAKFIYENHKLIEYKVMFNE